jgi:hypothetical protein
MATERQIAANRRNAGKSTGPRSRAGKKRARQNAYQHGLTTSPHDSATVAKQVERLAREIAGNTDNEIVLQHAREAAQAEIDLARVRRVKVAFIERASAIGTLDRPQIFNSVREASRFLNSIGRGETPTLPDRVDPLSTMPTREPERTAEAVRRALPDLVKLGRYESHAVARRRRAIREIVKRQTGEAKRVSRKPRDEFKSRAKGAAPDDPLTEV